MRRIAPMLLVAVVWTATAACAGGGGGRETIDFLVFGEPEEVQAYRNLVEAFEAEQEEIGVRLVVTSDRADLLTRISTSIAAGSPPELFLVNYRFYGQFAAKGALASLDERIAQSAVIDPEDYFVEALEAFQWEDSQLCLPQNVSSLATYYNRALFAQADLPEPGPKWTWDEMLAAARVLTRDVDADGTIDQHGLGVEPGIIRLAPFVWSSGGELFDDPEDPTRFAFDTTSELIAVQDFLSLWATERVVPSDEEMESEDLEARFLNGRLAMLLSSRRVVPVLRSNEALDWDVAPLPMRDQRVNILHADAYCLTEASSHHDAAWEFLEFALGADGQRITVATGRTVPSRIDVAESDAFLSDGKRPENDQVFLDAIPGIRRLPSISTWPEIEDVADVLVEEGMFEPAGGEALEMVSVLDRETRPSFERAEP